MPDDRFVLTPENYDGVTSALIGNGELCTTVGPTGYHTPPEEQTDIAHHTQHFVMAGRRRSGPQHPLINFGTLSCRVYVDGKRAKLFDWHQWVVAEDGIVSSRPTWYDEETVVGAIITAFVPFDRNVAVFQSEFSTGNEQANRVEVELRYEFGESAAELSTTIDSDGARIQYSLDNQLGEIYFGAGLAGDLGELAFSAIDRGASLRVCADLSPDSFLDFWVWIQFSDRLKFEFPVTLTDVIDARNLLYEHVWKGRNVTTGNVEVDRFRDIAVHTLRCQATPWSVPPTVSEEYWGAGAFHDEMYPFLGLLSSNYVELAERIPYFRLSTLPQAMQRARGRGALYPWSSTEVGEERDPNGLWLTERFHLGQFAVCIWMLWLYNRDRIQLDDLYPVLREIARYFELNMLERNEDGRLGTKACVDFDESVGPVTNGPFTICAAIVSLEYAANAAEELGKDPERIPRWRELAGELRKNIPTTDDGRPTTENGKRNAEYGNSNPSAVSRQPPLFGIPGGKPLHYSVLGPVFPFRVEVDSERARDSAEYIHRVCRSTKGWKPGFSEVFEGSNWMWTAAHLGIVHATQGNAELAWEAIREAPASAGPFLSPNEHVDKDGVIHVPWFTTGCGGWLYALNCLFVQVDEEGTKLLPAVPDALPNAEFRDLRADLGVLVSARFSDGKLVELSARAPKPIGWSYRIPGRFAEVASLCGDVVRLGDGWERVSVDLGAESTALMQS